MAEADPSVSAWRFHAIQRLMAARSSGHDTEAEKVAAELRDVHVALGERRVGTREEQSTYLLARSTRTPLPELVAVGINTNDWPLPPHVSPTLAEPLPVSPATEERITNLFRSAGPLGDRRPPGPRYEARYRPQDGQRFQGKPLPWAIWDTELDQAVSYHPDRDLAEYQAGQAAEQYAGRQRHRGRPT